MPGKGKYNSIRNIKQYRALKGVGFTKSEAAAISNASWNKGKKKKSKAWKATKGRVAKIRKAMKSKKGRRK